MEKKQVDVIVLSDIHLGTYGCRAKEVLTYLKSVSPRMLILNGDIIDIWQLSKHYFPPSHIAVIKEILQLMTNGTRVIYITGNHDESLRRYSDLVAGSFQLTDKLVIEIGGKLTWIFHGDVFDNTTRGAARFWARLGSNGYALLLAFNRMVNKCMKLMGREPFSISRKVMNQVNKYIVRVSEFENTVAEIAIEKKYDYVICGHTHKHQRKKVTTASGTVTYLNSGDWVENLTALEYYNHDWHIYEYREEDSNHSFSKMPGSETDVMTNEVAFYLHYLSTHQP